MANQTHVEILKQGVETWNAWRRANPKIRPDLFMANLSRLDLCRADLREADLRGADLSFAILCGADLSYANLRGADLLWATLIDANLTQTNFSDANLRGSDLRATDLTRAGLALWNEPSRDGRPPPTLLDPPVPTAALPSLVH